MTLRDFLNSFDSKYRRKSEVKDASWYQMPFRAVGYVLYNFLGMVFLLWRGVRYPFGLLFSGLGWFARQSRGAQRNLQRAWNWFGFDRILPPSVRDSIQWMLETIPKVAGVRDTTPWEQVGAAASLLGVAILATVVSGGLFWGTVAFVAIAGLIGAVRFIPAANSAWNEATEALPLKSDYNVRGWKRE